MWELVRCLLRSVVMRRTFLLCAGLLASSVLGAACTSASGESESVGLDEGHVVSSSAAVTSITSALPADRMAKLKAALPKVPWSKLTTIFADGSTFWYDHESMAPSYQETGSPGGGANANVDWFRLVAPQAQGRQIYDVDKKHWKFPFAGTAGMDDATNVRTVDFISLPKDASGVLQTIPISIRRPDAIHTAWDWKYPNGTVLGEIVMVVDGDNWLPSEVRTRERFAGGWATNAFRPFVEASALSTTIKQKRPSWASSSLAPLVQQLDGTANLTPKTLTAVGAPGTFDQTGVLDILPDFGDPSLVRELLTTTLFVSAYGSAWRTGAGGTAYAPSAASAPSITPTSTTHGLIEVRETSCMRCHKDAGRNLTDFYFELSLYGEIWGKDAIFTFHPFDERKYSSLDDATNGTPVDNRAINPLLAQNGMVEMYNASKHTGPFYDRTTP